LTLIFWSCNNEVKTPKTDSKNESENIVNQNSDSLKSYNELADTDKRNVHTISKYNADDKNIETIQRPKKPFFQNIKVDTTKLFGIWTQDPNGPHADFWLTSKSFYVVDYDGDGAMPYKLEKDELTIYYNDFIQKGKIISAEIDILKIIWEDIGEETKYVKFEN